MAKNNNLQDFLTDIANTIREENGTTELINPQDFESKITEIASRLTKFVEGTLTEIKASDLRGMKRVPGYAFYLKDSLTSIVLPDSVTSIGGPYAFGSCTALKTLVIPANAIPDDDEALYSMFYGDYGETGNIENLTASASIAYAAPNNSIVNLVINGGTYLEEEFFSAAQSLESVTILKTVESIGNKPFLACPKLSSINVEEGNTTYHSYNNCLIETQSKTLLVGCKNSVLPDDGSITSIGYGAFYNCSGLTSVSIPNSVTSIGEDAFYSCTGLTSLNIPNSVENIGANAFGNCKNLSSINVEEGNTAYHSYSNCLIETKSKTLLLGCDDSVLPNDNSVTSIGSNAFSHRTGLTSVSIPDSVTSIGSSAFYWCTGLTSVTLGNSLTSIGSSAFSSCVDLTSLSIPDSVTSIGSSAFNQCSQLNSINIGRGVTSIGSGAFQYCSSLNTVVYEGNPVMAYYIFSYCYKVLKYDFRNATSVPTLANKSYLGHASGCKIIVPDALFDSWKSATNWAALTDVVWVKASEYTEE